MFASVSAVSWVFNSSSTTDEEEEDKKQELISISDVEKYGKNTNYNKFYKSLKNQLIESIILVPIKLKDDVLGVFELVSINKYELNSINAYKLNDVIPTTAILEQIIPNFSKTLINDVKVELIDQAFEYIETN